MEWQVAEAKNRFSEMMSRALSDGPQRVRRRKESVVLISEKEYERLTGARPDFRDFLMQPAGLDELDLTRDQSPMRDVDL